MKKMKSLMGTFLLTATCLAASSGTAFADHPHYLHALSDLRAARWHLNHHGSEKFTREEHHAVDHIEHAIGEIKKASIDDGKDINDHPHEDAGLDRVGRLHRVRQLLDSAHRDCEVEEDNGATKGLRRRVLHQIDDAHRDVDRALNGT